LETKKKKLGVFRFGDYYIPFLYFVEKMGYELILPPEDEETLKLGCQHSTEAICLPFKILLGEYIRDCEMGAEELLMFSGRSIRKGKRGGACRLDFYPEMHRQILHDLGFKFDIFPFRVSMILWRKLRQNNSFIESLRVLRIFLESIRLYEYIRDLSYKYRPYEMKRGMTGEIYQRLLNKLKDQNSLPALNNLRKEAEETYEKMPQEKNREILRIPLIGEWGVQNISALNKDLDIILGELGVEVRITVKMTDFLFHSGSLLSQILNLIINRGDIHAEALKNARPYMGHYIGGMGQEAVGNAVYFAQHGYDGAIHMMPDTCMPEIIAKTALANIEQDFNFPILYITLDENTKKEDLEKKVGDFVGALKEQRKKKQ